MSTFKAFVEEAPRGGAYVRIPAEVVAQLGGGGRIPVVATFDGVAYRGSIVRMGGESVLGMLKEIREALGKDHGDEVEISVEVDVEKREVEVPAELAILLKSSPAALEAFEALSYTHRREHASYVAGAKKPEARERRARKTVATLTG
ncbi:MAG: YdeI/OmpD-associated family protein [Acidimicrobiia bacterium]